MHRFSRTIKYKFRNDKGRMVGGSTRSCSKCGMSELYAEHFKVGCTCVECANIKEYFRSHKVVRSCTCTTCGTPLLNPNHEGAANG